METTFVLGERTCPLKHFYSHSLARVFQCLVGDSPQRVVIDLDSPHCLVEGVEWRRLAQGTFVLGE